MSPRHYRHMDIINRFDCVVIGAGVVGMGIARELGERGMSVALIDKNVVGAGTSANSFAWINATAKSNDETYYQLNKSGTEAYRALAVEFGARDIGLHPVGMLEWASPDNDGRLESLRERASRLSRLGYPVAWVKRDELMAMEPHIAFGANVEGLHAFADAWLDVATYLRFGKQRIQACNGAVFEHCAALELVVDDRGKVSGVSTTKGRFDCDNVVVAVGADTPTVLSALTGYEGFSARFPMQRAPGLLVKTPPDRSFQFARHILYEGDTGIHLRESPDGGLLLGSDETDGMVEANSPPEQIRAAAQVLLDRVGRLVPAFSGAAVLDDSEIGIGIRAVPADDKSIAGPMPASQGLYIAVTHSGVTLSLALAKLLADAIERRNIPGGLAPYSITRFPGF